MGARCADHQGEEMKQSTPTKCTTQSGNSCVKQSPDNSMSTPPGYPSKNDLLMGLKERWSEDNRPFHFPHAFAIILGHVALLRSHDAPLLHRASGFPLRFVSNVMLELLRNPLWQSNEGYIALLWTLEKQEDIREFDIRLGELI